MALLLEDQLVIRDEDPEEIREAGTVYKIDTIDVDGKPEVQFKSLKVLVGERGFEPPTPWSRTRFWRLSNSIEFCRPQVLAAIDATSAEFTDLLILGFDDSPPFRGWPARTYPVFYGLWRVTGRPVQQAKYFARS